MMRNALIVVGIAVGVIGLANPTRVAAQTSCEVTSPNGVAATTDTGGPASHGNRQLSVMGLWPDGTVVFRPGGPGFITRDGALGMKFGWSRAVRGQVTIEGRRLDGSAGPLRSEVNRGYGELGFQATYVIFPTPGCWEVTASVGEAKLTFVTRVTKIGDGPAWRRGL